jgi:hypothetical protein
MAVWSLLLQSGSEGPSLYEAIIVKADLQSSHLLGPTWLSLTAAQ